MMRILTITTAADLFLDDISAEDYRELVMDHNVDCQCSQCQIFNKLVMLEENFSRYLQGQPVSDEVLELCQKKYQRYSREHTKQ